MATLYYILFEMKVDYLWFYGALSQSLAALVGVIGMFTVYRLQIQQDNIREAVVVLQRYLSDNFQEYSRLTENETFAAAETAVEHLNKENIQIEKEIIDLEAKRADLSAAFVDGHIFRANERIRDNKSKLNGWAPRLNKYNFSKEKREDIKKKAFVVIIYLMVLFISSLVLLALGKHFTDNPINGLLWFWIIILLLFHGLSLLVRSLYFNISEN